MTARRRAEALRFDPPRLEPEDAFVERLAEAARASRPSGGARRPLQGLRVGLAAAGVVGLTVGGAWAAGNLVEREGEAPGPSPATESGGSISPETSEPAPTEPAPPTRPDPRSSHGPGHDQGRPEHPGERSRHGDDHPRKGHGPDPERGRPSGLPDPGERGKGAEQRDERADPGGPKGSGGGRPADRPR